MSPLNYKSMSLFVSIENSSSQRSVACFQRYLAVHQPVAILLNEVKLCLDLRIKCSVCDQLYNSLNSHSLT